MKKVDLDNVKQVDLVNEPLSFERFDLLAQNPNLTAREKVGFPDHYREGFEDEILKDITHKLEFNSKQGCQMLDIGCGASPLTIKLLESAASYNISMTLNDSTNMLKNVNTSVHYVALPGRFPDVIMNENVSSKRLIFDLILTYSVFQYVYAEDKWETFIEQICHLLRPDGIALIGDIPNESKRKRFFLSDTGIAFHKKFMKTHSKPTIDFDKLEQEGINDNTLQSVLKLARSNGCNAYVVPQASSLPMANRREDILIYKL